MNEAIRVTNDFNVLCLVNFVSYQPFNEVVLTFTLLFQIDIKMANCGNFNWHISFVVKFLAQFCHCDSFRKMFLSNAFIQAIASFFKFFVFQICDQFKVKLVMFSLAKGGGAVIPNEEKRFVSYQRPRKPC